MLLYLLSGHQQCKLSLYYCKSSFSSLENKLKKCNKTFIFNNNDDRITQDRLFLHAQGEVSLMLICKYGTVGKYWRKWRDVKWEDNYS